MTQRAKHGNQIAIAMLDCAQSSERRKRSVCSRLERILYAREGLRPIDQPRTNGLQGLVRRAGRLHDTIEIRRIQMARNEPERFERLQQRWQNGDDVVHHGLAHRAILRCSRSRDPFR